ncbi:MAG: hypothetical protein K6A33_00720 [Clostridiales bacterium]|nr:hypothetical protein [Clostridiales bacterium]
MKKWFAWILVLAMLAVSLTACGEKAVKLDLSDYANALFRGADGEGSARGDFDYTGFEHAILEGAVETGFNLSTIVKFESAVTVTVSPDSGLQNGDRVTVTVTYDKDAAKETGLKITGYKKTVTVEGLGGASGSAGSADPESALIELDAFDPASWNTAGGITVSYEGISPYGYLEVKNSLPAEDPLSRVGYQFSETQEVHEGDTVTVTPYFTANSMKKEYRFREESGTYTVGAVDHYLMQVSELDAGTVSSLKRSAEQTAAQSVSGILEFQTAADYKGFYNGEAVTVLSNQAGNKVYAFRSPDGFLEALAIPCYLTVSVTEPDWMDNPQTYSYDLVFLCTVGNLVVHRDGSFTANDAELRSKGTADTEGMLLENLKTWYTDPIVETADFAG